EKPAMPVAGWAAALAGAVAVALPSILLYAAGLGRVLPLTMALAFVAVGLGVAAGAVRQRGRALEWLTLRSVLPITLMAGILLYPLVFRGLDVQRRQRMQDAAEFFDEGRDPGVLFALERVLSEAAASPVLRRALAAPPGDARRQDTLDSLAMTLLRTALPATRTPYDVHLRFLDAEGRTAGRFGVSEQRLGPSALDQLDADVFDIARQMYAERGEGGPLVDQFTGREPDRFQYVGLLPVGDPPEGWILAQAEPRPLWQQGGGVPLLRVLLPSGYGNLYASLSLAEFRDGVLVRSSGRDFGRYRLDPAVRQALVAREDLWRSERVDERRYLSYYRREPFEARMPLLTPEQQMIDAVRVPAFAPFDHLYYLLRLTVAGLMIGLLFFGAGLVLRRRAGVLPAPRVRFRDKVLNAFLAVGIFAILAVGALGVRVVSEENERAVQSWLRQHLERVEDALVLEARGEELPYRVVERVRLDSLAARVGLDLNLYRDGRLIRSSRPQFRYERLLDERLPIGAYEALYYDGYKFTYAEERLGRFRYTAGYRALLDEEGRPAYVVSIPTLPEQERIEEERARTLAYLFGALLLLVVVVMATAALLANALARPVARLRTGLRDVARGRFERKLPVGTRDEIGELVETFNEMQEQLAESRRKLAQQERQLAWREMARQVAHEIKNPLTPMKLSVQHLRRTFDDAAAGEAAPAPAPDARFARLFERVTGTLIEQIDTLARIANDFSTFARMPTRVLERLDLNEVVRQAVRLMQNEAEAEIALDLAPEPLVVEADQEELRRTFINLLKNAIQALPEDGAGAVRVTTQREGEGAYAAVIDTGTGIPDALHAKIFEPNFSTKTSGTGLGLAIARKTVEEHGGAIGFETEAGVGTTFWVRLPLAEA
ncbi:MAG: ATP-binding protein, partial [Rhodothermales bacterium]|nr:ATP-binding protein [Rhodothermales bacterium]